MSHGPSPEMLEFARAQEAAELSLYCDAPETQAWIQVLDEQKNLELHDAQPEEVATGARLPGLKSKELGTADEEEDKSDSVDDSEPPR